MGEGLIRYVRPALLVMSYVLTRFHLTGAVDIIFYPMSSCTGAGVSCINIAVGICCNYSPRASMRFRNSASCDEGAVYRNGMCASHVGSFNGNVCVNGGNFTGGRWFDNCPSQRRRLRAAGGKEGECTNFVTPNAVLYSEDPREGTWVIRTAEAVDILKQLESMSDADKIPWMKAQGATYEPEKQKERFVVAH
ncbi:hypothetical protein MPTK1_8g08890 [Marchantia polymorpha subsp. ruderalis]|uniref:Uncharacterized protein n=1 Tax=Marchantia polymorpha TaxID=3197 RepID=A0A2R6WRK7_MARPO|nr:hypothetical protein MARPO_0063s0030 [Marchantia polymorpha]BBN19230.1 hypothetical protein Mp_8g08890 [Marchantia polymorpha subsp. ruderalis]|eukprot:PTQ36482.1 hypothetical protein MARPO_0063s0030 [Marchantia polymorpha]